MNLDEAKANIGKEVVYIGNDKELIDNVFKNKKLFIDSVNNSIDTICVEYSKCKLWNVTSKHIKLKEQPMQNYKIKVTPETSAEVQELFFELGYSWRAGGEEIQHTDMPYLFAYKKAITFVFRYHEFIDSEHREITLPQLRDMVVLNRNSIGDATHEDNHGILWFIGCFHYLWDLESNRWVKTRPINLRFKEIKKLENISVEVIAVDVECQEEMTWQDALRAKADGKEVEVTDGEYWCDISVCCIQDLEDFKGFRIKPQTIELKGDYTKEDLLKIAGEME